MNTQELKLQERIDLLVDGELPDAERAALFGAVDQAPGGWRRCALAFTEAQTLGESLARAESGAAPAPSARRWWRTGGIAAALVAAFLAGRSLDGAPAAGAPAPVVVDESPAGLDPDAGGARPLFHPVVAEGGAPAYSTHELLPAFMLQALVQAGHRVQQVERTVLLEGSDGGELELPLLETRIVDMRPQAL